MQDRFPAASLAAHDLSCRRGDRLLFAGLSLALAPGACLHVTGANGTGKSSLIRILAGLLRPFAGHVEHAGAIGLVDERPALDMALALGRALGFWQSLDGRREGGSADNCLDRLDLADLLDVPVRYLSTGQKKRAALARLIGQSAPVWLLDEPLNGLDVAGAELAARLVDEHCAAGGICVIASHQPISLARHQVLDITGFAP